MRLTLLGTGSADGWPNPFCRCPSCRAQRATPRAPTSVLVDDTVLLDCGPETPRQAVRAGRCLDDVRLVWLGHAHPDHTSPMAVLTRSWAGAAGTALPPLTVVGPAAAVDGWRPWIGPDDPVTVRAVSAGDVVEHAGYRLVALPASHDAPGEALLCLLTAPDGATVLYGTDTGPLPSTAVDLLPARPLDAVLLEETFGDRADLAARGDHLDLTTFGEQLARLREHGTVAATTTVVAVHLSHHNPPEAGLGAALAARGARAGRDGQTLVLGPGGPSPPPRRRRVLVLGGARSGKSTLAASLLRDVPDAVYVATGHPPGDGDAEDREWADRVARHRAERPAGWGTVETVDVAGVLRADGPPLLVDCLTLWLSRTLDSVGAWDDRPGWGERLDSAVSDLADAWDRTGRSVVAVSNEVGSGVVPGTPAGRLFRDLQGRLNSRLAASADEAYLVVAGRAIPLPAASPVPVTPP